ncbi:MAG TPA: YihY/virulence factor BrkB family protein, partial [Pseudonocardiaceae bacterium]
MSSQTPRPFTPPPAAGATGLRKVTRVVWRTATKAWTDGIFGLSAQGAFWQTLSLAPLLLGLLGGLGYVASWFGPETVQEVEDKTLSFCRTVFDPTVVEQIIAPTVKDILNEGRGELVTIGFVISLWAGSSAMASFVDAITLAYRQREVRHTVWQRIFALLLYLAALVVGIFTLPVLALGPDLMIQLSPDAWQATLTTLADRFYYPVIGLLLVLALTTLYKVALPRKLPWHRGLPGALLAGLCFVVTSAGLRYYIAWVTSTGITYGALATPIAFLLFLFFIGFAIILGAQLNNAIEEAWPAHMTKRERRRWRRLEMDRAAQKLREEAERAERGGRAEQSGPGEPRG